MGSISMYEQVMEYRKKLITFGKKAAFENPDKLIDRERIALTAYVFNEIDKIDMQQGYPHHDTGIRVPPGISAARKEELFVDFIDWYNIVPTPSNRIYDYVLNNYDVRKYPRVLCVGDGENVHLGRKLAQSGYSVVSVDPRARKEFTMKKGESGGFLHIVQGEFYNTSTDMISWANLIVGSKVTEFTEQLLNLGKPTVFNISKNAEIYNMRFKGKEIRSSSDLERELEKCEGISIKKEKDAMGEEVRTYIFDPREREI